MSEASSVYSLVKMGFTKRVSLVPTMWEQYCSIYNMIIIICGVHNTDIMDI